MAYDASSLLGSRQIAGVRVLNIRGTRATRDARPFSVGGLFGLSRLMLGRSPVIGSRASPAQGCPDRHGGSDQPDSAKHRGVG
jgi:hypothetical protein